MKTRKQYEPEKKMSIKLPPNLTNFIMDNCKLVRADVTAEQCIEQIQKLREKVKNKNEYTNTQVTQNIQV
jgi:exo-beta-1,3-glucanase (GH17 family)